MEQQHRLVSLAGAGEFTVTKLCADFHSRRQHADLMRSSVAFGAAFGG